MMGVLSPGICASCVQDKTPLPHCNRVATISDYQCKRNSVQRCIWFLNRHVGCNRFKSGRREAEIKADRWKEKGWFMLSLWKIVYGSTIHWFFCLELSIGLATWLYFIMIDKDTQVKAPLFHLLAIIKNCELFICLMNCYFLNRI